MAATRSGVSSAQTSSRHELTDGRNLHLGQRRVEMPVLGGRPRRATRSTFYFAAKGTPMQRGDSSNAPSTCTACPRRSRSTRAVPTQQRSSACAPPEAWALRCANRNTSTSSSNKITGRSNASCDRCSDSSQLKVLTPTSRASRPCTGSRRSSSIPSITELRLRLTSSTLSPFDADRFEGAFTLSLLSRQNSKKCPATRKFNVSADGKTLTVSKRAGGGNYVFSRVSK